jgi:medium-chain acyl-[acyl-carrier-protein] hydrolase
MAMRPMRWIVPLNPDSAARVRILCFAYAGGGVSVFAKWPLGLPVGTEICAVQLPGREGRIREQPTSLAISLDAVSDELDRCRDVPLVLFGHSMGSLLAFELARRLRSQRKLPPVHLVASGLVAPQLLSASRMLHTLPDSSFIREIQERYGGIPKPVLDDPAYLSMFVPALRADIRMLETYRYVDQPPLSCPITVFGGDEDSTASHRSIQGWRAQTVGGFDVKIFPGGHFFVNTEREAALKEISRIVRQSAMGMQAF